MFENSEEVIKTSSMVKCPICGKLKRVRGKKYFTCCLQMAFDIEQCLTKEFEGKIWKKEKDAKIEIERDKDDDDEIEIEF